jgi:predicted small metal-binding protein
MKVFNCRDLGHGCDTVLQARNEDQLIELASVHLRETHGMPSLLPGMTAKIRNIITNSATVDAAKVVDRIFETYNCDGEPECTWRYIAEAETILNGGTPAHEAELRAA